MEYIEMIELIRAELIQMVNQKCDEAIQLYQKGEMGEPYIKEARLAWISPAELKGKKPLTLQFESGETIQTSTWKKVVQTILKHCNNQPEKHEILLQLRGKVFGRQRTILGSYPEEMDVPIQIDKDLYFEGKFDTEALITVMTKKVLEPVGYDYGQIVIKYKESVPMMTEEQREDSEGLAEAENEEQGMQIM